MDPTRVQSAVQPPPIPPGKREMCLRSTRAAPRRRRVAAPVAGASLVVALAGAPASAGPARAPAAGPESERAAPRLPTVQERLARGLEYFEAGNFDGAIEEFQVAYAATASPAILLPWAQSERGRGNCREAIALYQRFIDTRPLPEEIAVAERERDECQARLKSAEEAARTLVPGVAGEVVVEAGPAEAQAPVTRSAAPRRARPDALGWSLVGIGAGVAIAGAGVLAAAAASESRAKDAGTYGEFGDLKEAAARSRIAGGVVSAVGVAVLLAGVVRLAVHARKRSHLRAWVDPRGGLIVGGRF